MKIPRYARKGNFLPVVAFIALFMYLFRLFIPCFLCTSLKIFLLSNRRFWENSYHITLYDLLFVFLFHILCAYCILIFLIFQ